MFCNANIDNFDATKYSLEYDKLAVMDKWLLSRLESTVKAVDDNLANYRIPEAAKALQSFVDDMSNWYATPPVSVSGKRYGAG